MVKKQIVTSEHTQESRGTLTNYIIGFTLSIILTLGAYTLVVQDSIDLPKNFVIYAVVALAVVQLMVQLQYFIHLGRESKPGWNKLIFMFTTLIILILVIGSMWIMSNLHYNVMSPNETNTYIQEEEGIHK